MRYHGRMKKRQLHTRLGSHAVSQIITRFNDREIDLGEAMNLLQLGKSQVYRLRTQWLNSRKSAVFLGVSGGDHAEKWPPECIAHLRTLIEASRDDGPNFGLYADELARKFGFRRDRSNVRKYCMRNLMPLMRSVFSLERPSRPQSFRRWEREGYGELYQHDSTPRHIWGPRDTSQNIIISLDDATRKVMACRVCERELITEHFTMLEESFLRYGLPEAIYTDGFTMFGQEGEDIKSQFGRMCRAFGINHLVAPTPQAKGKIERAMRTFQHRLVVVLKAECVDCEGSANIVAREHCDFWNASHMSEETGVIPDIRVQDLIEAGRSRMRPVEDERRLKLFLSQHIARRVESGQYIEFDGREYHISKTFKQHVWLALRPEERQFYVLEAKPDPTVLEIPRILGKFYY